MKTIDGIEIKEPVRYDLFDQYIQPIKDGDYIQYEKYDELDSAYQDVYDAWQTERQRADELFDQLQRV